MRKKKACDLQFVRRIGYLEIVPVQLLRARWSEESEMSCRVMNSRRRVRMMRLVFSHDPSAYENDDSCGKALAACKSMRCLLGHVFDEDTE